MKKACLRILLKNMGGLDLALQYDKATEILNAWNTRQLALSNSKTLSGVTTDNTTYAVSVDDIIGMCVIPVQDSPTHRIFSSGIN